MWKQCLLALCLVPGIIGPAELLSCPVGVPDIGPVTRAEPDANRCLAVMIWGEARAEPKLGQIAVAYSAVNRARNRSICDVVLAPKQYSVFNGNPTLRAAAMSDDVDLPLPNAVEERAWQRALRVAEMVLEGRVKDPTDGATHYLAPQAMRELGYRWPQWARQYTFTREIAGHRFYRPCYPRSRCIKEEA